jgi:hypothetical protein
MQTIVVSKYMLTAALNESDDSIRAEIPAKRLTSSGSPEAVISPTLVEFIE